MIEKRLTNITKMSFFSLSSDDYIDSSTQRRLQSVFHHFQRLKMEPKEFSYLKALILYRPETPGIYSFQQSLLLQEQTLSLMYKHCMGSLRLGHLLMLLLHVREANQTNPINRILLRALGENGIENAIDEALKL